MHVLFDTNVLLDALLERQHVEEAYFLLDQVFEESIEGSATPTVLTNTFYIGRSEVGRKSATRFVRELLKDLEVLIVSRDMLRRALRAFDAFEDGAIGEAAATADVDVICTRNQADFQPSAVPALSPKALIQALHDESNGLSTFE